MEDHMLVYVTWDIIQKWKKEARAKSIAAEKEWRPPLPYVYASGNTTFKCYVKKGTVLWIVSCPEYGAYRLPPTLIARLAVKDAVPRDGGKSGCPDQRIPEWFPKKWSLVAIADADDSVYLPVNNAFVPLKSAQSERKDGKRSTILDLENLNGRSGPYTYAPRYLRFPKRLAVESVPPLMHHARSVKKNRTVFVSYCRKDKPRDFTGRLVEELTAQHFSPWLDMQSVPPRVASGEARLDPEILEHVLSDGIRQAHTFVAIVGLEFLKSKWAREEWNMAMERRRRDPGFTCAQVSLNGIDMASVRITTIVAQSPLETGRRIREVFEKGLGSNPD